MYGCDSDTAQWCTGESVLCMAVTVTLPSGVQVSVLCMAVTVTLPSSVQVSVLCMAVTVTLPSGVQVSLTMYGCDSDTA